MITAAALTFPHFRASGTSVSGQRDAPVRRTAVTCNDTIQVTIYNCRIRAVMAGDHRRLRAMRLLPFAAAARTADLLLTIEGRSGL
jgi:hypothetical protein